MGVDCLIFGKDISHLIAANKDIRVFGLKSGKVYDFLFKGYQGV